MRRIARTLLVASILVIGSVGCDGSGPSRRAAGGSSGQGDNMTKKSDVPEGGSYGQSARERAAAPAANAQQAIDAFVQFWRSEFNKSGGPPAAARLDSLVRSQKPSAALRTYAEYKAFVTDRIGAAEPNPAVLFGSLAALPLDGKCWDIHYDGLLSGGLDACVDAQHGRVVFVWETPGG